MWKKFIYVFFLTFFLSSCSDNSIVKHHKNPSSQISCLNLVIFPPDKLIEESLSSLYTFKKECSYKLQVSQKAGIVCNSSYNSDKKIKNDFPSSYLRLELFEGNTLLYSYYVDLKNGIAKEDVQKAFKRAKKDMNIN